MTRAKEVRLLENLWATRHAQVEAVDLSVPTTPLPLAVILSLWSFAQTDSVGRPWLNSWYTRMHMGEMIVAQIVRLYRLYETRRYEMVTDQGPWALILSTHAYTEYARDPNQ